jgi:hypothetical protein
VWRVVWNFRYFIDRDERHEERAAVPIAPHLEAVRRPTRAGQAAFRGEAAVSAREREPRTSFGEFCENG